MTGPRNDPNPNRTGGSGHYTPQEDTAIALALLRLQAEMPNRPISGVIRRMEALRREARDLGTNFP